VAPNLKYMILRIFSELFDNMKYEGEWMNELGIDAEEIKS